MTTLITDGGRYEISKKVADLLRNLFIKQHESEPYHQHQNKAERRYGFVKRYINTLMNLTGAPAHCWLLCMLYVCHLLNATASPALGGLTPLQALTGQVPDISHFLHFSFWEPIYYNVDESEPDHRFPSQSNEKRGHWVGFAENKGDQLTWKILTDDTNTIIIRSAVRSATKTSPNLRLDPQQGEDQPQDLTSDVFFMVGPILKRGHWVGFAENKGDQLTWKILTDDTNTIIIRSAVRSATKTSPNLRLDRQQGEDQPQDLTSDVFFMVGPILKRGHWVGFAENKGDQLTWKILTDDTNTIIIRSAVRSATKTSPNLRLDPQQGEDQPQDLTSDVVFYGRPNPEERPLGWLC